MSYEVGISAQAEDDLRGIFSYIAYELGSVQNAVGQLSRLEKSIYGLDEMPERYRAYQKSLGTAVAYELCRWITTSFSIFPIGRQKRSVLSA